VPGGSFDRSSDAAYPATVSGFLLDRYEVNVGRFRKFLAGYPDNRPASGDGKNPNDANDPGWDEAWNALLPATAAELESELVCKPGAILPTYTPAPGGNEQRPINCVSWPVAFAFCIWDDGRLPTEAEWNFAAAGGAEQRAYPWTSGPTDLFITPNHASYSLSGIPEGQACWGDDRLGCTVEDLVAVGSKPLGAGLFGQSDLAGNVWEWTRDSGGAYVEDCNDCANFAVSSSRVGRGGGYYNGQHLVRTEVRLYFELSETSNAIGVRCARAVP
jgi:formylglycine-generating enzyme required for sulfatase activity